MDRAKSVFGDGIALVVVDDLHTPKVVRITIKVREAVHTDQKQKVSTCDERRGSYSVPDFIVVIQISHRRAVVVAMKSLVGIIMLESNNVAMLDIVSPVHLLGVLLVKDPPVVVIPMRIECHLLFFLKRPWLVQL
jgi:hypothetical protein